MNVLDPHGGTGNHPVKQNQHTSVHCHLLPLRDRIGELLDVPDDHCAAHDGQVVHQSTPPVAVSCHDDDFDPPG
jgi:hypothetical protein